jgi:hypothetical protein
LYRKFPFRNYQIRNRGFLKKYGEDIMFGNSARKEKGFKVLLGTILFCLCIIISPYSARAAAVSWTDATGNWDVGGNWSGGAVPVAADDVTINVITGVETITVRSIGGPFTINSLTIAGDDILAITGNTLTVSNAFTNNANTNISGGSLILNGVSSMGSLTQSGGTLGGTGTVSISGLATWTLGTMTGAAPIFLLAAPSPSPAQRRGAGIRPTTTA